MHMHAKCACTCANNFGIHITAVINHKHSDSLAYHSSILTKLRTRLVERLHCPWMSLGLCSQLSESLAWQWTRYCWIQAASNAIHV